MTNRRTGAMLALLTGLIVAAAFLAGCGETSEPAAGTSTPSAAASSSAAPSPVATAGPALSLGETATVAGFELTPTAVRTRKGPVYDIEGERIDGKGLLVTIEVAKTREADLGAGELTVPVATLVAASGETVRMDDLFGMVAVDAQSDEYNTRYAESYNYACIQPPGNGTTGTLWFGVPAGMTAERLVIDGGAGQQAAWLLD